MTAVSCAQGKGKVVVWRTVKLGWVRGWQHVRRAVVWEGEDVTPWCPVFARDAPWGEEETTRREWAGRREGEIRK